MIKDRNRHFFREDNDVRQLLSKLNELAPNSIAFMVDAENKLMGSVTDGDIRRGLINGFDLNTPIDMFIQKYPQRLNRSQLLPENYRRLKEMKMRLVPVVDDDSRIIDIINIDEYKSLLPLDAVIMAGGEGTRLRPKTLTVPKPLLKIGDKPIVEYNVDRLRTFGLFNLTFCIKYLGEQIKDYFGDGSDRGIQIDYVWEKEPLGTFGGLKLVENFKHNYILIMNSDLLTDINFENMFQEMMNNDADMVVAMTSYQVNIPYGVIETNGPFVSGLKEKPTYAYYSNAGIYILKKEFLEQIPEGVRFDATDMMEMLLRQGKKVCHYHILGYWLDIGRPEDLEKAQKDIKHLNL